MKRISIAAHFVLPIILLAIFCTSTTTLSAQEVTAKQKRQIKTLATTINKAGQFYKSGKFKSAADRINTAQQQLQSLTTNAGAELIEMLGDEYKRLQKAHELLSKEDVKLDELIVLPAAVSDSSTMISFSKEIAPILISNCGRCHVQRNRGDFSARTYQSLMNSLHVSAGRPDTSRIVEVIADGDMPPNGTVPVAELEKLKNWIGQGAKFDGPDPGASLNELTGTPAGPRGNRNRVVAAKPTGSETVSFGLDVAPILIEACSGCHINSRNVRGNLSMDNFARLLRGGDSGNIVEPGKPDSSLLIKRLKGIGVEIMPPNGKLSDEKIKTIETWIAEGATFDGPGPQTQISTVAAISKANAQTHEQLLAARNKLGIKNWNLIMSDDSPDVVTDDNFRFIGKNRSERLDQIAEQANQLRTKIIAELNSDPDKPFLKGNPTIFVFEKRYDLNELGLMLVGREIPKNQVGRWDYDAIDAYAAVLINRGKPTEQIKPELTQQLTALHTASLAPDVPRWFADGVGYMVAAKLLRKEETVKNWTTLTQQIVSSMQTPADFTNGKLSETDAGLAAFAFVTKMKKDRNLGKMLPLLQQGSLFEDAFTATFGMPMAEYFKTERNRGQRRR